MIPREIFERSRVLLQAQLVREFIDRELRKGAEAGRLLGEAAGEQFDSVGVTREELVKLRRRVRISLKRARREVPTVALKNAYMPRDPTLANLQSLAANQLTIGAPLEVDEQLTKRLTDDQYLLEGIPVLRPSEDKGEIRDPVTKLSVADRIGDALTPRPSRQPTREQT